MSLEKGTRLGIYEITAHIGHGGMGEVYRARDTTLGRDVAIKTLPSELAKEPDRLARFEREAKLLAGLNHPHIAVVYGLHEHDGTKFIAMELVDGETLGSKLQGPLPVENALRLALQIAGALEAAHEKGVVHRDLKPANIMVTRDDQVKVLDFGLAKAFSGDPGATMPAHSPALSLAMTKQGFILGTAGYMSPEQASGQASDQRADIWAFGVVLYEMLAGSPLFAGESVPHILADVLRTEPDWTRLPKLLHPRLKLLLERCLTKNARNRYHSIAEARVDIEAALSQPVAAGDGAAPVRTRPRVLPLAAAVLAGAVAVAIAGFALWPEQPPRPVIRFATSVGVSGAVSVPTHTISRDGTRVAFWSGSPPRLYVRKLGEFEARPLPQDPGLVSTLPPCFSPDGDWLVYSTGKALKKIAVAGGAALTVADDLDSADVCDWGEDGNIYFGVTPGIMRVAAAGGRAELVAGFDAASGETSYENPHLLPGGGRLLFTVLRGGLSGVSVAVLDLATHEKKVVLEGAGFVQYARSGPGATRGHILYGRNGTLFAAPFDVRTLKAGPPSPTLEGVAALGPISLMSVSDTGTLVYASGGNFGLGATLRWVDRAGAAQDLPEAAHFYSGLAVSPDGRRAAVSILDLNTLNSDLWLYELDGDRLTRLTFGGVNGIAVWTPDGQRLIYWHAEGVTSADGELRAVPADNSAPPVALATLQGGAATPTSISADGTVLIGSRFRGSTRDLWSMSLDDKAAATSAPAGATPKPLLETTFDERDATLSPDARFLAYTSDESGRDEVYVIPYPGPGGKAQVSTAGGKWPHWNRSGRELFYVSGTQLLAVEVETSPVFRRLTPKVLFEVPAFASPGVGNYGYDVAPDGSRFLMPSTTSASQQFELRVVVNWFEELRRLAPAK